MPVTPDPAPVEPMMRLIAGYVDTGAPTTDQMPRQLEALLTPGRDEAGSLDPAAVTATLVEFYQDAAAPEILTQLLASP